MAAVPASSRIGEAWQQRIGALREYEVVRDGNVFGTNLFRSCLKLSEQSDAHQLLAGLLERYRDRPFEEVFSGTIEENEAGSSFLIRSRYPVEKAQIDPVEYFEKIWHDLTLVHGIGEVTQRRLKARGYATIRDLARHPRFRPAAGTVIRKLEDATSAGVMELVGSRHQRSHPIVLGAAGFHEPEDFVFVDIETLGLFSRPIILICVGTIEGRHLAISQYLLRSVDEEPAALIAALGHLSGDRPALVTYNGKAFDLPYLQERLAYYGMGAVSGIPHFDCLHFARGRWRDRYPSLRLSALEREIFGVIREDDVPGQMVPEFYDTYLKTGNCGPLVPIVTHNRQDVLSLAMIFFRLIGETYGNC
jgi:uncharacterized protein YprB with RNaseH-like and TPR domain